MPSILATVRGNPSARPIATRLAKTTRLRTGRRWNQNPCMYDFRNPTWPPSARDATLASSEMNVPRSGSSTSSRVSREIAPAKTDRRTCGNRRSIRAWFSGVIGPLWNVLVVLKE